jgi:putative ABC transport system permease protein
VSILMLGLGIGAATAIFSVVSGVLLRPLPYADPDRLTAVWQVGEEGGEFSFSHPNFEDVRERSRSFESMAEYSSQVAPISPAAGEGEAIRVSVAVVSGDFFRVMGVQPVQGRPILPHDVAESAPAVVVSERFWRERLGGADLSGLEIRTGERVIPVVGIMPDDFAFPAGTEIWAAQASQEGTSRTAHNWRVVARLRDGVTVEQARQELSAIARELKAVHGDDIWMVRATANPLHDQIVGSVRPLLLMLLGAAALLLLIACANVVNLLLARTAGRCRELSVRLAVGAGRGRLMRQFLAESLVLAGLGGAIGLLLAVMGTEALLALEPGHLPRVDEVSVSGAVLGFGVGVALLAALALGTITALRASGGDLRDTLSESSRTQSGGAGSQRLRSVLAAGQIALTLVLLVGAGLLARSFLLLLSTHPGYRTSGAVTMDLYLLPPQGESGAARLIGFTDELLQRVSKIAGVQHAGAVDVFPLSGGGPNGNFLILTRPDEVQNFDDWGKALRNPDRVGSAQYRIATAGYFRAAGIPLLRGRLFDERDGPDAPHAAVISESLARAQWPSEDPIGKLIQYGNMDGDLRPFTIVGIVGDVRERSLEAEPQPTFYGNALQRPRSLPGPLTVVMADGSNPTAIVGSAHRIVRSLDPEMPLRFRTLDEVFSESLAPRRFSLVLLGAFAATALLLAIAGIYGVISYLVAQRTREIGIRLALGAGASDVLRLVVGRGAALAVAGVAIGLMVALAATRVLSGLLYGVGARDPITFIVVPILLGVVAALASYIPARYATRVDPMITMRAE